MADYNMSGETTPIPSSSSGGGGDFWGAVGGVFSGAGSAIGGGLAAAGTAEAQRLANEANITMNRENNAYNAYQTQEQRKWQESQTNTAHQREVLDLQAAGLNPILSANKGAASASGGMIPSQAGHVEPAGGGMNILGEVLARGSGTAVQTMQLLKDLEGKDAQIAATRAAALASVASANNSNASAKSTEASMPSVAAKSRSAEAEADAAISTSKLRRKQADTDAPLVGYDAAAKRIIQAIDGGSSAASIIQKLKSFNFQNENQIMKKERHLRQQGLSGTELP